MHGLQDCFALPGTLGSLKDHDPRSVNVQIVGRHSVHIFGGEVAIREASPHPRFYTFLKRHAGQGGMAHHHVVRLPDDKASREVTGGH